MRFTTASADLVFAKAKTKVRHMQCSLCYIFCQPIRHPIAAFPRSEETCCYGDYMFSGARMPRRCVTTSSSIGNLNETYAATERPANGKKDLPQPTVCRARSIKQGTSGMCLMCQATTNVATHCGVLPSLHPRLAVCKAQQLHGILTRRCILCACNWRSLEQHQLHCTQSVTDQHVFAYLGAHMMLAGRQKDHICSVHRGVGHDRSRQGRGHNSSHGSGPVLWRAGHQCHNTRRCAPA